MSLQKLLASASRELPWRPSFKLRFSEINVLFVTNYWQIETVLYQSNPSSISSDIGRYESPNIASRSRTSSVQVEVQTCHRLAPVVYRRRVLRDLFLAFGVLLVDD